MKMTLKKGTPLILCCSFIKLRDLQEAVGSLSSSEIEKKKDQWWCAYSFTTEH